MSRDDWDGAWKRLFEQFPADALQAICGLSVESAKIIELPTERQRPMLPDRVFTVVHPDGSDQLVHVEIQVRAETGFELRLATYFTLLAAKHGTPVHQVVVLPVGGPYTGHYRYGRLALDYDVVDVTRLDPEPLLAGRLAPLALWSTPHPELLVETVVERISAAQTLEQQTVLVELAILRSQDVAILIRDSLERRGMSNVLEGTKLGQELEARGKALGEAQGEARGKALGEARAVTHALLVMLRERFGDVPGLDTIAASLATTGDFETGLHRIRSATSPQDLTD